MTENRAMISNLPFIVGEGTEVLEPLFSTFGFSTSKVVDHRGSLSRDGINTKSYENRMKHLIKIR